MIAILNHYTFFYFYHIKDQVKSRQFFEKFEKSCNVDFYRNRTKIELSSPYPESPDTGNRWIIENAIIPIDLNRHISTTRYNDHVDISLE